ncbi:putative transposase [Bordetella petrii]|uniref:Transposase n=1 Tax=Bordetella petrii (strain ATCC BAA-461 / DSM 12804 / CCUG 43448 / CIP 107267 / Se-1111R) TaxID=340100 RepID=A9IEF3_BORPD|nr:putative transposase [Bordetella petrii]
MDGADASPEKVDSQCHHAAQLPARSNALAETINGLYKAELIHRRAPWRTKESVELATLPWVSWFNHHRLLEPIGYIPPAEAEANYYRQLANQASMVVA